MRRVHLIAVAESLVFDLALAAREKDYEVSTSDDGMTGEMMTVLRSAGCICHPKGWNPERMTKDIHSIVLGATVRKDNPELLRARELGLLIQSVPEFVFQRTKEKMRVVVAGSSDKSSILSMIVFALKRQKLAFDYALTSHIPELPRLVSLSYEARIALVEGYGQTSSTLENNFQLEFYRPHIAILTSLQGEGQPVVDVTPYRNFAGSIEREGKLIYFEGDPSIKQLAAHVREDITAMPYDRHAIVEHEGVTYLQTRYGEFPVYISGSDFLMNLNAARLACRQMGVKDADFYQAISDYSLSLQA